MNPLAKFLVVCGLILIVSGLVWQFGSRILPLGRLPGDIVIERDGARFHFPIVTCLVLSLVLSLLSAMWRWLNR